MIKKQLDGIIDKITKASSKGYEWRAYHEGKGQYKHHFFNPETKSYDRDMEILLNNVSLKEFNLYMISHPIKAIKLFSSMFNMRKRVLDK